MSLMAPFCFLPLLPTSLKVLAANILINIHCPFMPYSLSLFLAPSPLPQAVDLLSHDSSLMSTGIQQFFSFFSCYGSFSLGSPAFSYKRHHLDHGISPCKPIKGFPMTGRVKSRLFTVEMCTSQSHGFYPFSHLPCLGALQHPFYSLPQSTFFSEPEHLPCPPPNMLSGASTCAWCSVSVFKLRLIVKKGPSLYCISKQGFPCHPLYMTVPAIIPVQFVLSMQVFWRFTDCIFLPPSGNTMRAETGPHRVFATQQVLNKY